MPGLVAWRRRTSASSLVSFPWLQKVIRSRITAVPIVRLFLPRNLIPAHVKATGHKQLLPYFLRVSKIRINYPRCRLFRNLYMLVVYQKRERVRSHTRRSICANGPRAISVHNGESSTLGNTNRTYEGPLGRLEEGGTDRESSWFNEKKKKTRRRTKFTRGVGEN